LRLADGDARGAIVLPDVGDGGRRDSRSRRRNAAARRAVHAARGVHPVGGNGGRLLSVPLSERLLAAREPGAARGPLLLHLAVLLRRGRRPVEPRRDVAPKLLTGRDRHHCMSVVAILPPAARVYLLNHAIM